ncbi:long-chain-fatty-acid--CoA ligase [Sphaerisporangium siamense]|uniref:Fatty-acyl-CoA synthase n=1 Tax=Sphaerisporangium siamense TaxID=795645 RepID=A0A7W7D4N6_9ACTN|nr:long-chain fatty acid--CoA ligase [Sphaerisporangium siamense]MBB4700036.1 fatty-acyl-CoA synthase [Sphaerisporangium siamense]GII84646.1 long-chain-fatty-acid--CoA ligase [Sphaerisporangium siamense]
MRSTMPDHPLTITSIMRHGTGLYADHEVATYAGNGYRRLPYGELAREAARLAGALRGLGVAGDRRVATFAWNNTEHLTAYLAVPGMGAVLHTLNIRLFPDQIVYIANHAEDDVLLVDASLIPLLAPILPEMKTVRHVIVAGEGDVEPLRAASKPVHRYRELLDAAPDSYPWPELDERAAASMCYTSGTTGNPKGVVYSHRSSYLHAMAICTGNAMGVTSDDKVLPIVPMFHANAWGMPYAALMSGASLVMPDRYMRADLLVKIIEEERPTISGGIPMIFADLLRHARQHHSDLSSLRLVPCGGSAVPESLMRGLQDEFGVRLVQAWGMTETSPLATVAHGDDWSLRVTQGRLLAGVEGRIVGAGDVVLDADGLAVGELEVRGPWVTASYHKDDDASRFHDGWLRTGDVGRLDARGYVTLTDRAKDVIKSGGEWISSVELENALMAHPAVVEAAVIGVPDERWGERPLACVVLDGPADVAELKEFLAGKVARWQVPERWAFVETVPKTSVGKFAKRALREMHARGELTISVG